MGIGLGGTATLYIPLVLQTFDPRNDTTITGAMDISAGIAALAMPPLGTGIVAYTGSFTGAILLTLATLVGSIWVVYLGTRTRERYPLTAPSLHRKGTTQ